jgi:hypothetical protein
MGCTASYGVRFEVLITLVSSTFRNVAECSLLKTNALKEQLFPAVLKVDHTLLFPRRKNSWLNGIHYIY